MLEKPRFSTPFVTLGPGGTYARGSWFCQNVPRTDGAAAGAAAAATAGAAAATALIFTTTQVVAKIAAAAPAAAAPAVPGTFWQNPGIPGNRYPLGPG